MSTVEIKHRVGIRTKPETIFKALTDTKEITKWWSKADGDTKVGENFRDSFGEFVQPIKVTALETSKLVRWQPTDEGAPFWVKTIIEFRLERDDENDQTLVYFTHSGYAEPDAMFCKSSTHWAVYLLSLKELIEQGEGRPFPNQIECDHD